MSIAIPARGNKFNYPIFDADYVKNISLYKIMNCSIQDHDYCNKDFLNISKTIRNEQPSHYGSYLIDLLILDFDSLNLPDFIYYSEKILNLAPYEYETLILFAPFLVKNWYLLPVNIRLRAGLTIELALKSPKTRENIILAMKNYHIVKPFVKFSPDFWVEKRLSRLAKAQENDYFKE